MNAKNKKFNYVNESEHGCKYLICRFILLSFYSLHSLKYWTNIMSGRIKGKGGRGKRGSLKKQTQ